MKQPKPTIHPNANKKLARLFRQVKRETGAWNIRETARRIGVNQRYVDDNLIKGIEPTDATENGRMVREKMFMKPYKPHPRTRTARSHPESLTADWWDELRKRATRAMVRETNDAVVRRKG